MADLTEAEVQRLFNQTSKALREDDSEKLSTLMSEEAPEEEAPTEEVPATTEEVIETPEDKPEDSDSKDEEEAKPAPSDKKTEQPTEPKDEAKPEPTELDKLKEQLEKLSRENHSLRSQAGRVPHVQRRIKELDKKLEELEKNRTSPSSQPSAKINARVAELLSGVKETDAELADAIAKAIEAATGGVDESVLTGQIDNIKLVRQQELESYREVEVARLLEMYPNAPEVVSSPSWTEWKNEQPLGIQRLADSDNADEVSFAFQKYATDMVAKHPELAKVEDKKTEEVVVEQKPSEEAQKVETERQRKKQTSVVIGSTSAPAKVGVPDDQEALFNKFSEQIRKERTG